MDFLMDFVYIHLAIVGFMAIPVLALLVLEPKTRKIAGVVLAAYLAVYGILSYHGEYVSDSGSDGSSWWAWGCAPDRKRIPFRDARPSTLCFVFFLLIELDQKFVHGPPR